MVVSEIKGKPVFVIPDIAMELVNYVRVGVVGILRVAVQLFGMFPLLGEPFDQLFAVTAVGDLLASIEIGFGWCVDENDTFNFLSLRHRNTP